MGWSESKKCKPIPAPPRGAGLKSRPITFAGRGKPARAEAGRGGSSGADQAGRGGVKLPSLVGGGL